MAIRFKDTISINEEYTLPSEVGTTGQYIKLTDAAAGTTAWADLGQAAEVPTISYEVRNETGSSIPAGSVVYVNGGSGSSDHVTIALSDASTEATSSKTFGVTAETIANNSIGKVVLEGIVEGIDTSLFSPGDTLWLSTTAGQFTGTPPSTPDHAVFIGYAVRCQQNNGSIFVKIQNGYELGEIHDVLLQSLANGDVLIYDGTNTYWQNASQLNTAILIPSGTDGQRPTPAAGMLRFNTTSAEFEGYNGTEWGAIGGSEVATVEVDSFTGDGTTVDYTLTSEIPDEKTTQVYIDGVYQSKGNYSVSGTTLTFSTAPPNGTAIEVVHFTAIAESTLNGSGTANYVTKWQDADTLANSVIQDNGTTVTIGNDTIVNGDLTVDTNTLYVDAINNRVGIGTLSPTQKLNINGNVKIEYGQSYMWGNVLALTYDASDNFIFKGSGNAERMRIHSGGDISFRDTSTNEAFYWDASAARLGIGAGSAPTGTLTAFNDGHDTPGYNPVFAIGSGNYHWRRTTDGSKLILDTYYGGWNPTFTVDRTSGGIGIGTASPSAPLTIQANSGGIATRFLGRSSDGYSFLTFRNNADSATNGEIGISNAQSMLFYTGATERLRIDSNGRVGINQTSPASYTSVAANDLVIGNASGNRGITLSSATTGYGAIAFADGTATDSQYRGLIQYGHTADSMQFYTGATEKMRISSSGNVGIGISSGMTYPLTIQAASGNNSYVHFVNSTTGTAYSDGFQIGVADGSSDAILLQRESAPMKFYTASAERMRIDSSGNVGIGTANNNYKLNLSNSNTLTAVYQQFTNGTTGTGSSDGTVMGIDSDGDFIIVNQEAKDIKLYTSDTERMRITSGGNVGIGTAPFAWSSYGVLNVKGSGAIYGTPAGSTLSGLTHGAYYDGTNWKYAYTGVGATRMESVGSSNPYIAFYNANSGTADNNISWNERMRIDSSGVVDIANYIKVGASKTEYGDGYLRFKFNGGSYIDQNTVGQSLFFRTSYASSLDTTAVTISSSGNVGIGTTSPQTGTKLHLSNSGNEGIEFQVAQSANVNRILSYNRGSSVYNTLKLEGLDHQFYVSGSEKMRITSGGVVRIFTAGGTSEKTYSAAAGLELYSQQSDSGYPYTKTSDIVANGDGTVPSELRMFTKDSGSSTPTERMRITSGGNLGISSQSPDSTLTLGSTTVSDNSMGIKIYRGASTSQYTELKYGGNFITNGVGNDIVMQRESSEVARFTSNGLCFGGDYLAANALDDYEEGTWTPTLYGSYSAGSYSLSSVYANYRKIGSVVHVSGYFVVTVNSAGSGYAIIGGLPFTKPASQQAVGSLETRGFDIDNSVMQTSLLFTTYSSSNTLYISGQVDNASSVDCSVTGFSTGDSVIFSITYFV